MKKKLKLNQLNVESFVTTIEGNEQKHVKGGESIATVCVNDSIYPTHCCITETYHVTECGCRTLGANCETNPVACAIAVTNGICG